MSTKHLKLAAAVATCLAVSASAGAQRMGSPCRQSIDEFNAALDGLDSRLRTYERCARAASSFDECETEFTKVKSAQSWDLRQAVISISSYCRLG